MLKALRALEDLRTILDSLLGCMFTMDAGLKAAAFPESRRIFRIAEFWSLVLLAFLLCLFAIFFAARRQPPQTPVSPWAVANRHSEPP